MFWKIVSKINGELFCVLFPLQVGLHILQWKSSPRRTGENFLLHFYGPSNIMSHYKLDLVFSCTNAPHCILNDTACFTVYIYQTVNINHSNFSLNICTVNDQNPKFGIGTYGLRSDFGTVLVPTCWIPKGDKNTHFEYYRKDIHSK